MDDGSRASLTCRVTPVHPTHLLLEQHIDLPCAACAVPIAASKRAAALLDPRGRLLCQGRSVHVLHEYCVHAGCGCEPQQDAATLKYPVERVAIDVGGVLATLNGAHSLLSETTFRVCSLLELTPLIPDCLEGVAALVAHLGPTNVHIVSKAQDALARRSQQWLDAVHFHERTGLPRANVHFVAARKDKEPLCRQLGITTMVDDTLGVLECFFDGPYNAVLFGDRSHDFRHNASFYWPALLHASDWAAVVEALRSH